MKTAKIFLNGQSQAVRLPKEFRFEDEEVFIKKVGKTIIIFSKKNHGHLYWKVFTNFLLILWTKENNLSNKNGNPFDEVYAGY